MAECRKFTHAICVKTDAKTEAKFELFPAEQWGGPAGCYRVRRNRSWLNTDQGTHLFMPLRVLGEVIVGAVAGEEIELTEPCLPKGSLVRVRRDPDDPCSYQRVHTKTEPWRGWDGNWYVQVRLYGRGDVMVTTDQCEPVPDDNEVEGKEKQ
jgi:hypothetical protein